MRVAVFASGNGSNFQVISDQFSKGNIPGKLVCLFCDMPEAYVTERAKASDTPYFVLPKKKEQSKSVYEKQIIHLLDEAKVDLIVLAGYMKIIGKDLLAAFPNRIINLHPSLLPKFPGARGIEDAFNSTEKKTGITIHLVDEGVDTGPIIFQKKLLRTSNESLLELTTRVHELEYQYYPKIIAEFIRENREK